MVLDRPFGEGRVQTANVAVSAYIVSTIIYNRRFNLPCSWQNDLQISYISDIDESAETGVSDQRGRQQSFTQAAPNELKLGEGG